MTSSDRRVTGGVDAHGDTHDAAALEERGRRLGTQSFSTDAAGQRALLAWLEQFGELSVIGVESTGSYAAGLVRYLRAHMVEVVEVNWPHAHAHAGGAGATRSTPRCGPPGARSALAAQDHTRQGHPLLAAAATHQPARRPAEAAKFALRSLARRITELDEEITALDRHLTTLVATAAPRTTQLLGISTGHAGQLLVTAGQNIDRPANDGAFAAPSAAPARSRSPSGRARRRVGRRPHPRARRADH